MLFAQLRYVFSVGGLGSLGGNGGAGSVFGAVAADSM